MSLGQIADRDYINLRVTGMGSQPVRITLEAQPPKFGENGKAKIMIGAESLEVVEAKHCPTCSIQPFLKQVEPQPVVQQGLLIPQQPIPAGQPPHPQQLLQPLPGQALNLAQMQQQVLNLQQAIQRQQVQQIQQLPAEQELDEHLLEED